MTNQPFLISSSDNIYYILLLLSVTHYKFVKRFLLTWEISDACFGLEIKLRMLWDYKIIIGVKMKKKKIA